MAKQSLARRNTRHAFVHSVYITQAWDWLLEFVGRGAEAILVASVLYASVKLLPVVHMPPQLDVIVFIAQFVALDVGGLSLGKLAKQAKAEHNEAGALQAGRMSKALITVMIAGVVVVAVEQLFTIPGNWKIGIDTVLLIARSILAVLYGHIVHTLKTDDESSPPALTQIDEWPLVAVAAFLQSQTEEAIAVLKAEQQQAIANTQRNLETLQIQIPMVDTQEIAGSVLASLESRFTQEMKHLQADLKQQVSIWQTGETPAIEAPRRNAKQGVSAQAKHSSEAPENIVAFHAKTTTPEDADALIIHLYNEDRSRSHRKIASMTGIPEATVYRKLKRYIDTLASAETPESETDEAFGSA